MGRPMIMLSDSVSKKAAKTARKDTVVLRSFVFVLAIAVCGVWSYASSYDNTHGTNGIASRNALHRQLAECEVKVDPNATTTPADSASASYPTDIFTLEQKRQGAIVLHVLGMIYMFVGIAIICDDYFEAALEHLCEELKMSDDVAGATFMAAGGSAPELFTSIMGVFISKSDVGFGTIIGSAVFNVLFVIALCAWICPNLSLTWWPLCRDSVFYCFGILALTAAAIDQEIHWWEALLLLGCYFLYVTVMAFNIPLRNFVARHLTADTKMRTEAKGCSGIFQKITNSYVFIGLIYLVIVGNIVVVVMDAADTNQNSATSSMFFNINLACSIVFILEMLFKMFAMGAFGYWAGELNAFDGVLVVLIFVEWAIMLASGTFGSSSTSAGAMRGVKGLRGMKVFRFLKVARVARLFRLFRAGHKIVAKQPVRPQGESLSADTTTSEVAKPSVIEPTDSTAEPADPEKSDPEKGDPEKGEASKEGEEEGDDDDDDDEGAPWAWPLPGSETPEGIVDKISALINFPLHFCMIMTVPHPDREGWSKWWPMTFIMCILWIAFYAFFMVWWAEALGETVGIPPAVMGLTLLAGGTSIPDAMSSIAVAKRGHGDMAVSSSIGSNIFDILFGLPVPWTLYTLFVGNFPDETVPIYSSNMSIMILTLFIMVSLVITLVHWAGWKLTVGLGWAMMAFYVIFLTQSLLLEYGVLDLGGGGC